MKRQNISAVFNKSSLELTPSMTKLLSRGLNFAVLSNKLDITQILVDWKRFERTMIWKEWWFNKEDDNNFLEPLFKKSSKRLIQFILALNSQWLIQCKKIHLHNVTVHTKNQSHT